MEFSTGWLKNNVSEIHAWTVTLFAKEEYMISAYIQCTDYNVGDLMRGNNYMYIGLAPLAQ